MIISNHYGDNNEREVACNIPAMISPRLSISVHTALENFELATRFNFM